MIHAAVGRSGFATLFIVPMVAALATWVSPGLAEEPASSGTNSQGVIAVAAEQPEAGAISLLSLAEEVAKPGLAGSGAVATANSVSNNSTSNNSAVESGDQQVALPRPLTPMAALGVDIGLPEGKLPRDFATERAQQLATPAGAALVRGWPVLEYHWAASGARSFPLYFEEVNAERYGYTCSYTFQPVISAAHFFGTIPYLPYLMAADCPRECTYALGHYRPGNCNPWRAHSFPLDGKAAGVEGAAVAGLIFLLP